MNSPVLKGQLIHFSFSRSNYVEATLDMNQSASLLTKFAEYLQIAEIARAPVNLEILCTLWSSSGRVRINKELDQGSLPGLYREVTARLLHGELSKWDLGALLIFNRWLLRKQLQQTFD